MSILAWGLNEARGFALRRDDGSQVAELTRNGLDWTCSLRLAEGRELLGRASSAMAGAAMIGTILRQAEPTLMIRGHWLIQETDVIAKAGGQS